MQKENFADGKHEMPNFNIRLFGRFGVYHENETPERSAHYR